MLGRLDEKRIVSAFKWGFLSDRIVETIKKYKKTNSLSEDDREIINDARELLSNILKGEEQYNNGKYNLNALESFVIFNRSMNIISTDEFLTEISSFSADSGIGELVTKMDSTFNKLLESNKLSDDEITLSLIFFDMLRALTLDESQHVLNAYYENRGRRIWAHPTESML